MTIFPSKRLRRITVRAAAAVGLCIALSGCIVVPVGHYHPHRYYY